MNRFLFDTHVHTAEVSPCGVLTATEVVRLYHDAGYSGLVITDHYFPDNPLFHSPPSAGDGPGWDRTIDAYLRGYRLARQEGERLGLTVLWGLELTLRGRHPGDYLVHGLDEAFLRRHRFLFRLELAELRGLLEDHHRETGVDAVVCQAHPYRPGQRPADPLLLDALEVFNASPRHDSHNERALAYARRHGLRQTAGSDTHQEEDVGQAGLWLPQLPRTPAGLAALLRSPEALPLYVASRDAAAAPFAADHGRRAAPRGTLDDGLPA